MVKKCDPAIFSNQIKNLLESSTFVKLLILTLILFAAQTLCAQTNYYNPFTSYNSSSYGINSGATYSNDYYSSSNYALPSLNSYYSYPGASSYSAYPSASSYSAYPNASSYSAYPNASSYSAQNSLYYPNAFGSTAQSFYYPSASTGSYYNTQNAYTPAQNSYYSSGAASPYPTQNAYSAQGSFYYPSSGFGQTAQTNSYYNAANTYYPAANTNNPYGTGYYSNATSYYPSSGGYVVNSTTSITGTWIGTWVRNYSSTGAPTAQSGSNSSNSHSMNSSSSTTNTSHSGSSSSSRYSSEDIKIELTQNTSSVNGTVTFFENTVINQIPVSGTLVNGVLDLYGTTGTAANPYGLQVNGTINAEDACIQGGYTLTNTTTNANIEYGTFNVEK